MKQLVKIIHLIPGHLPAILALALIGYAAWPIFNDSAPTRCQAWDDTGLRAQSVYTNLQDPAAVAIFTEISESIICQCGCNFILASCPHQECPWGIPARRFIENRIQSGMTAPEILVKLEDGFGESARKDPVMIGLAATGQTQLVDQFVHGYGRKISALSSGFIWPISLAGLLLGAYLAFTWWKRNRRSASSNKVEANLVASDPDQGIDTEFHNLDR